MVKSHFLGFVIENFASFRHNNGQRAYDAFWCIFRSFLKINMSASWPTVGGGGNMGDARMTSIFSLWGVPYARWYLVAASCSSVLRKGHPRGVPWKVDIPKCESETTYNRQGRGRWKGATTDGSFQGCQTCHKKIENYSCRKNDRKHRQPPPGQDHFRELGNVEEESKASEEVHHEHPWKKQSRLKEDWNMNSEQNYQHSTSPHHFLFHSLRSSV